MARPPCQWITRHDQLLPTIKVSAPTNQQHLTTCTNRFCRHRRLYASAGRSSILTRLVGLVTRPADDLIQRCCSFWRFCLDVCWCRRFVDALRSCVSSRRSLPSSPQPQILGVSRSSRMSSQVEASHFHPKDNPTVPDRSRELILVSGNGCRGSWWNSLALSNRRVAQTGGVYLVLLFFLRGECSSVRDRGHSGVKPGGCCSCRLGVAGRRHFVRTDTNDARRCTVKGQTTTRHNFLYFFILPKLDSWTSRERR